MHNNEQNDKATNRQHIQGWVFMYISRDHVYTIYVTCLSGIGRNNALWDWTVGMVCFIMIIIIFPFQLNQIVDKRPNSMHFGFFCHSIIFPSNQCTTHKPWRRLRISIPSFLGETPRRNLSVSQVPKYFTSSYCEGCVHYSEGSAESHVWISSL